MSENQLPSINTAKSNALASFSTSDGFDLMQRVATAFSKSDLVPTAFKGNMANCVIGVELANRIGASPLMVMQNLNIIHGRPSFSSTFVISAINSCGQFSPLRFRITGEGDDKTCTAWATDKSGEVLEGPPVSIGMAKKEGWFNKNGSKWQTMPDLMLRYRAAAFFGRLYAPQILMGMQTVEEVADLGESARDVTPAAETSAVTNLNEQIEQAAQEKKRARKQAEKPAPVVIDAEPVAPVAAATIVIPVEAPPQPEPVSVIAPSVAQPAQHKDGGEFF